MRKQREELQRPHGRAEAALVRGGPQGMYWQAADGLVVRVAAPEREPADRAGPPKAGGGEPPPKVYAQHAVRDAPGVVGPAGLAIALWMRLFAEVA